MYKRSLPVAASAAVALSLLTSAPSPARAATLTGRFTSGDTGAPLPWVTVILRSTVDSTIVAHAPTDSSGRFTLADLHAGRFHLRAILLGYAPYVRADVVIADSAEALDLGRLAMTVAPIAVKGVETSTARGAMQVTSDRNIYFTKDLPGSSTGTTTDLLRSVPELDVDIDDKVSLRGSSSVTIQINGRTSPLKGDALTNFLRQLPASRIERVEVIANPSAKYDPEGTAGIVNLVTKEPLDLGLSGSFWASAGNRGGGSSSRLAWQQGKLTLSGGVSSYLSHIDNGYDDHRENLLAAPRTIYDLHNDSSYRYGFGSIDASGEWAFDRKSTLYGWSSGYLTRNRSDGTSGYVLADVTPSILSSWDRPNLTHSDWHSGSGALGFQHVVVKSRNEWSVEANASGSPSTTTSNSAEYFHVPTDSTGVVSLLDGGEHSHDLSIQADDTYPLGKVGKLQTGYRFDDRRTQNHSTLIDLTSGATGGASDYVHREAFHSGYLTAGTTVGHLSFEGGLRGEAAHTTFDQRADASHYDNDYRSAYPSANVAWDFGKGRTLRLTYSKRIERPGAWYLNPDVPTLDSLNRVVGNPYLTPKYTHSYGLDATWSGSRGLIKLSPYYRRTVDNWDYFKTVDSSGVSTSTWRNASSLSFLGVSLVSSLRQTGRFGGTTTLSVYRERHDASNFTTVGLSSATNWSLDANLTYEVTKPFAVQTYVRYRPAQTLAQGRQSATLYTYAGARWKLGKAAWINFTVNDPFGLWKYEYEASDVSFIQNSSNRSSTRRYGFSAGWSWGKPPQSKVQKKSSDDAAPQQEQPAVR